VYTKPIHTGLPAFQSSSILTNTRNPENWYKLIIRCTYQCNLYVLSIALNYQNSTGYSTEYPKSQTIRRNNKPNQSSAYAWTMRAQPLVCLVLLLCYRSGQGTSRSLARAKLIDSGCLAKVWRYQASSSPFPGHVLGCRKAAGHDNGPKASTPQRCG
jgi:hypothetical protein